MPASAASALLTARNRAHLLKLTAVALLVTVAVGILFYYLTSVYVTDQAERNIQNLLLSHKSMHQYVQEVMHPALYKYQRDQEIPKNFYAPELFSSSFIVRNMHTLFNRERRATGLPGLYYKMAAINPRNPVNRADPREEQLIRMFNERREVKKYREVVTIEGRKYLYYALPFLENTEACLRCHGRREDAPRQLQTLYPDMGGYDERVGDIRAIVSIRAPLEEEFSFPIIFSGAVMSGLGAILLLFLFNSRLQATVRNRTAALEREVAERRQTAAALQESEQRLRVLMDSTAEAIYGLDLDGNCIFANPACLEMLGYSSLDELLGRNMHALIHHTHQDGRSLPPEECQVRQASRMGEGMHVDDEVFWRADSTCFPVEYWAYPMIRDGVVVGSVVTFMDITDRQQLEERLRQGQKMEAIGTMAGGIAHDFNNILMAVIGYADLAKESLPPDNPAVQELNEVLKAGHRARDLVRQILTFSRKAGETRQPVEIRLAVQEALKLLRATIPTTVEIRQEIVPESGLVLADPIQLHQVLINLCTNASQAMEETGGELRVTVKPVTLGKDDLPRERPCTQGGYVRIEVSDTGIGIDPAVLPRIFDPYFTTKEVGKGSGMGLAVVHGIVERHGGFVSVRSEPGSGTTFIVHLPRFEGTGTKEALPDARLPRGNEERLLLVDDEEAIVRLGKISLEQLGYRVRTTTDSTEALRLLRSDPEAFDLLITDQTMPHLAGDELARQALAIRPDLPIILATGYSSRVDAEKAREAGIDYFLTKPFLPGILALTARKALDEGKKKRNGPAARS